jgi:hypothetical protein
MRKRLTGWVAVVTGAALLLSALGVGDASAWDRGRGGFHHHGFHGPRVFFGPRVFVGPRFYYPYYYPYYGYPYPYYEPPVVVAPPPTDYVQRPPAEGYWYYCQDPPGYYPTVATCPGGWIQVAPRTE